MDNLAKLDLKDHAAPRRSVDPASLQAIRERSQVSPVTY
jgi:hypothetical protein